MHIRLLGWLGSAALCLVVHVAAGQSAPALHYTLAGIVTSLDGVPVVDAEVVIVQSDARERALRSDSVGRFLVTELTVPRLTVHVRRLGYQPKSMDVNIRGEEHRSSIVIALDANPAELNKVSVVGEEPDMRLRDYETRKATNSFGKYIDGAAIEKRRPQFISEMLRTVPGMSLSPSPRIGNTVHIRGCSPLVWVDGVRLPGTQLDEVARAADVAAMEIYSSYAGIPAQFFDRAASCGTILVWTRAK